jgi:diketogulonate reductase-like aldo/keto reductase
VKNKHDVFVLSNGVKIPCIGFGTWLAEDGAQAKQAVLDAFAAGYTHIDTAEDYGNEQSVGDAIKESGIAREYLFVTSKLQNRFHSYHLALGAFEETMRKLQLDYLDLFLIHWPNPIYFRDHWQEANAGAWKAMEELYRAGRIRAIGISNFQPRHIDELLKTAEIVPMANQIRLCPGETQTELVEYCRAHDMLLEAYSPFGHGDVFRDPAMQEMAHKYSKTVAQICVRWSLQRGYLPLPKSVSAERIKENIDVFDFELTQEDMDTITHMPGYGGFYTNPDVTNF